jgi:plastocyanin
MHRMRWVVALAGVVALAMVALSAARRAPVGAQYEGGGAQEQAVTIVDFAFNPSSITVPAGTRVTWTNTGQRPHTTSARGGQWDSGTLMNGQSFSFTFQQAGTYAYQCNIHPAQMQGTVVVQGGPPAAQPTPTPPAMPAPSPSPAAMPQRGPSPPRTWVAVLTGAEEVPVRETPASGVAVLQFNEDATQVTIAIYVANITNVAAAHIHLAPVGENGPIVLGLYNAMPGGGPFDGLLVSGTYDASALSGMLAGRPLSDLLEQIRAGNAYVNVHTNDGADPADTGPGDFPGGEIRGQIARLGG